MAITELIELVPPPARPFEVPDNPGWKKIEKAIGLTLPDDYKDFVLKYGSGLLGNFIIVSNPFSTDDGVNLESNIGYLCETQRHLQVTEAEDAVPFAIYPDESGIVPWGGDENGNGMYWLTEGKPNEWPTVVLAGRDNRWQQFDMPMTTFLAKALSGEVRCKIWPPGFSRPKRRRIFAPYD